MTKAYIAIRPAAGPATRDGKQPETLPFLTSNCTKLGEQAEASRAGCYWWLLDEYD